MSQREDEPIVDVERRKAQADYTLGDPLLFPLEFLNWLKRYIEQSGITLPASSIFGGGGAGGGTGSNLKGYPPGLVFPYAGGLAPLGSLPADGSLKNIADYPDLYAILGDSWGVHTATQFYLPDLRDRALFGAGVLALGTTDLQPPANRGPLHRHTVTEAPHTHTTTGAIVSTGGGGPDTASPASNPVSSASINPAVTGLTVGPAGKPLDAPAFAVVLYVITTGA